MCSAAAGGLGRDELHNEVLHKGGGGGGGAPVPATVALLGGSPEKEGGGAASGDDLSELPRGTGGRSRRRGAWGGCGCRGGPAGRAGGGWARRGGGGERRDRAGLGSAQPRGCPGSSSGSASERAVGEPPGPEQPGAGPRGSSVEQPGFGSPSPCASGWLCPWSPWLGGPQGSRAPDSLASRRAEPFWGTRQPLPAGAQPRPVARAAFQAVAAGEGMAVTHPPPTHGCSSYLGRVSQPAVPATGALGTLPLC